MLHERKEGMKDTKGTHLRKMKTVMDERREETRKMHSLAIFTYCMENG